MKVGVEQKNAPLALIAMTSALGFFAALQIWAYVQAGVFEYPLDDVYIHLSMAAEMARGGYGVNHGEYASAASSPLYPVLLMPFSGTSLHRYLPLFWNILALGGAAYFWGRILRDAGYGGWLGLTLAVAGPLVLNMPGVAFSGMEHTLHVLATLAALAGLQRFMRDGRFSALLLAGMILGPMLRFEGLAISLAIAVVIGLRGRPWAALAAFAAAVVPVIGFCFWLTTLGLAPLPNSVMAKLTTVVDPELGLLIKTLLVFILNLVVWPAPMLLAIVVVFFIALVINLRNGLSDAFWPYALALVLAGGAHLLVGKTGWMYRYENYILVFTAAAALIALAPPLQRLAGIARRVIIIAIFGYGAVLGSFYIPQAVLNVSYSPSQIYRQQAQMARFQKEYLQAPVAVNDLGWVAYGNDHYVLDLFGLASKQALDNRLKGAPDGWADALAQEHNVKLAMIYQEWMGYTLGPDWVFLGTLDLNEAPRFVAFSKVRFYAPTVELADELRPKLQAFATTLPKGASFVFAAEGGQD